MKSLVDRFPTQLDEALAIAQSHSGSNKGKKNILNIVISGLGGSGIGGTIIADLLGGRLKVPVIINKDYHIPAFVNENTLFIASSYSGNTEETLEATQKAISQGAEIACITSGGQILALAKDKSYNYIQVPSGYPPRSCIGYSMVQLLAILSGYGLIGSEFISEVKGSSELLKAEKEAIYNEAKKLANFLYSKMPIIYTSSGWEGVAVRFRQQLNENSKELCWHHILPEMNHNELVGWVKENQNLAVVYFRSQSEYSRTAERFSFLDEAIGKFTSSRLTIFSKGKCSLEEAFYLIHLGDWASVLLAEKNKVDAMDISVIDKLKAHLAVI